MGLEIQFTPFGREASRALRDEIARAQGDDRLAPVTVVVPRGITGLGVRRLLASGDLGPASSGSRLGVANLRFTTFPHLVAELAGSGQPTDDALPATDTVVRAVARMTLGSVDTGVLVPVRDHPGTARALVRVYRDLIGVSGDTRRRLTAGGGRAAEVVSLVESMEGRLRDGWLDDGRRVDDAIESISTGGVGVVPPLVAVYLPTRLSFHDERLVTALASVGRLVVMLGVTGDAAVDAATREMADRLGGPRHRTLHPVSGPQVPPLTGTSVISAPTADTEVRVVAREVMARRWSGTRFERMAIVHGGSGPYERLVREVLAGAGVPCHGLSARTLATTFAGRTLLGAFELHVRGWRRPEVMAWVAGGPPRARDGRPVAVTAWDLISGRPASPPDSTVGSITWRRTSTAGKPVWRYWREPVAPRRPRDCTPSPAPGPPGRGTGQFGGRSRPAVRRRPPDLGRVGGLGRRPARPLPWPDRPTVPRNGRRKKKRPSPRSLRPGRAPDPRPAGRGPDRSRFAPPWSPSWRANAPRDLAVFGTGVLVGPINLLAGLDFDTVFVVGMVDGRFPTRDGDDTLLPDAERVSAGEDIPLRGGRRHDAHRALPGRPRHRAGAALIPRGDQRRGGDSGRPGVAARHPRRPGGRWSSALQPRRPRTRSDRRLRRHPLLHRRGAEHGRADVGVGPGPSVSVAMER